MTAPSDPGQPSGPAHPPYPGPQQPAAPYGSYPVGSYPVGPPQQRPPAPDQPRSISLAVKLMWAGAALSVLSLLYTVVTLGSLKDRVTDQLRESDPSVTQAQIDAAYAIGIVSAFAGGLIGVGLWLWMAWKNGQGRSWARVVATVLGGLNLLFVPFTFYSARSEPVALVTSGLNVLLAIAILLLLWRKESTQFYDATAASRRFY